MWASVAVAFVILTGFAIALDGWLFQKAARWLGVEIGFLHAVGTVLAAGIAQVVAQVLVAVLVLGSADVPLADAIVQDQALLQITGFVFAVTTWTALTSVLLDVDLLKAAGIGLLFTIVQVVFGIVVFITIGNLLLLALMAALAV